MLIFFIVIIIIIIIIVNVITIVTIIHNMLLHKYTRALNYLYVSKFVSIFLFDGFWLKPWDHDSTATANP